jgi:hypothetical protein
MTRNELMTMAAEKAAKEVSLESIEFLFRPATLFELLLRSDFDGTVQKFHEALADDGPDAMPHRLRSSHCAVGLRTIEVERFYREIKRVLSAGST